MPRIPLVGKQLGVLDVNVNVDTYVRRGRRFTLRWLYGRFRYTLSILGYIQLWEYSEHTIGDWCGTVVGM